MSRVNRLGLAILLVLIAFFTVRPQLGDAPPYAGMGVILFIAIGGILLARDNRE